MQLFRGYIFSYFLSHLVPSYFLLNVVHLTSAQTIVNTAGIKIGTFSINTNSFGTCQSSGAGDYYNPNSFSCAVSADSVYYDTLHALYEDDWMYTRHQSALMHDHLISPCCIIRLKINYAFITVTIPNILLQTCGTNQIPNKSTTDGQGNYIQCRCAPGYSTIINDCLNVS